MQIPINFKQKKIINLLINNYLSPMTEKLDFNFLRQVTGGDTEFEKELFTIFAESSRNNIEKMERAVKDSDDNAWHMASHSFKGAAASIGAFDLSKILEVAQHHGKGNFEEKSKLLDKVKSEYGLVSDFIQTHAKN